MQIDDGILKGSRFVKANASGGSMSPRFIVLHDTAGSLRKFSSVEWFASKECGTSAHFVVERDGTITQLVATNKRAFHAGASSWRGISGLNSCSVGIEIVNPGKLDANGNAYFGKAAEKSEIMATASSAHGTGYWLPYTKEQIEAVVAICRALIEEYPDCNEIVTHYEISPGRKIDVGPQFPLEQVRKSVFHPTPAEAAAVEVVPPPIVPAPPSVTKEAVKSPNAWMLVTLITGKIADFFFGAFDWVSSRIGDLVTILKSAETEAGDIIAPLASLGEKLQVNLGNVAMWLTVGVLAIVVARTIKGNVEKAKLEQQLPTSAP